MFNISPLKIKNIQHLSKIYANLMAWVPDDQCAYYNHISSTYLHTEHNYGHPTCVAADYTAKVAHFKILKLQLQVTDHLPQT